jgi:hypothetical protein
MTRRISTPSIGLSTRWLTGNGSRQHGHAVAAPDQFATPA